MNDVSSPPKKTGPGRYKKTQPAVHGCGFRLPEAEYVKLYQLAEARECDVNMLVREALREQAEAQGIALRNPLTTPPTVPGCVTLSARHTDMVRIRRLQDRSQASVAQEPESIASILRRSVAAYVAREWPALHTSPVEVVTGTEPV